jgi:DNA-directed RNA polymerase specialized sigma24 family protein/LysM repeat protein
VKRKFFDFDKPSELSPDLEWMLQSGQVSRQLLLETLVEYYFSPVYRLALSLTNDVTAVHNIVREIFSYLVLNPHKYRSHTGVDLWVYKNTYRICLRALRGERFWRGVEWWTSSPGQFTNPLSIEPPTDFDKYLWRKIDALDERLRVPLVLHYVIDWEIPFISLVSGLSEGEVEDRISAGLQDIKNRNDFSERNLETQLKASLHARWGYPDRSEITQFINHVNSKASRRHILQGSATTIKELMLVGLAILLVILAIWGGNRYLLGEELLPLSMGSQDSPAQQLSNSTTFPVQRSQVTITPSYEDPQAVGSSRSALLTPTPTPSGVFYSVRRGDSLASIAGELGVGEEELRQLNRLPVGATVPEGQRLVIPGSVPTSRLFQATPVAPVSPSRILSAPNTSEDVFNIINPDEFYFNTLWFSAEILTHDPSNLAVASKITQIQVWLSPRQFLMIGGQLGEEPQEVSVGLRGRLYVARPGYDQPWFHRANTRFADPFIDPTFLYGLNMLFGEIGDITASGFVVLGDSLAEGREAWVVGQLNSAGERIGLLYLDKETGFILRYRRLTEPDFYAEAGVYLPDEVVVKVVSYDVDFPQELFDISLPWRGGYAADYTGRPGYLVPPENEHSGLSYNSSDGTELPEDLDLSSARLSFRFPIGLFKYMSMAGTEIYTNGYYLGRVDMGIPWNLTCQRTPDGQVIVYRTKTSDKDDLITRSNGPYYLTLSKPLEIRRIIPGAQQVSSDFAISPNSQYVAIWACERNGEPCGVYLHDIEEHRWRRLVDIQDVAADIIWSPKGDQLAFRTREDAVWIVSAEDGEVLYTADYDSLNPSPLPLSPLDDWDVQFPPRADGLEACINPPGE